jgi:phosphoribosylformylglycinamidine synthase
MTDLMAGRFDLADVTGLVACGGFSYGDTLGAGEGWARSVLFHPEAHRGVPRLLPPPGHLRARHLQRLPDVRRARRPHPRRRRLAAVHPQPLGAVRGPPHPGRGPRQPRRSSSPGMASSRGSRSPSPMARASPTSACAGTPRPCCGRCGSSTPRGAVATTYPANPNGSPDGLTAVTTPDGRFTAMMPHPERVQRNVQLSWTDGPVGAGKPVAADVPQRTGGASSRASRWS